MINIIFFCDDEGNGAYPKNRYLDMILNYVEKKGELAVIEKINNYACLHSENEKIEFEEVVENKNVKEIIKVDETVSDVESLKNDAQRWAKELDGETFVVRVDRKGNHEYTSVELERELGAEIWKISKSDVDLKNPQKTYRVFIQDKRAFVSV